MRFLLTVVMLLVLSGLPARADEGTSAFAVLEGKYFGTLDDWAAGNSGVESIQNEVVPTCGKLIMLRASTAERTAFSTTQREDFHSLVDICTKITVHRKWPQPEFENPEIRKTICASENELLLQLCVRAGVEP